MPARKRRRECVYVIGAGFSAGLGFPLTSDLLVRLWDRIDDPLKKRLRQVITFHHPGFNPKRFSSFPNVEQLLSEMLVNEELFDASRQYEGRFTKAALSKLQSDLLLKIGDWFHEISKGVDASGPKVPWLQEFRDRIERENAAIISFNWDLILDELFFGGSVDETSYGFANGQREGPILLKPHGSLNWFEETQGRYLKDKKRALIFEGNTEQRVYAFREPRAPVSSSGRIYTPLIVPPVYLKNFESPVFQTLWKNCTAALSTAREVVFLGYSMPAADLHAQFIMRCGFQNQIEGELGHSGHRKKATGAAEVIIVNPDRGAAERIAAVAGPKHECRWISTPVADWIGKD